MRWRSNDDPGASLRLAYCLNLHPAADLDELLAGMQRVTLPLRERLTAPDAAFGVGPWLPAELALHLDAPTGAGDLDRLAGFLVEHGFEPFTFNAFPYGGFHRSGLKQDVFRPTWADEARVAYTNAVARVAARLAHVCGAPEPPGHVSISTHPGAFGAWITGDDDRAAHARNLARTTAELARIERDEGVRIVLSLEAEPRASCGDLAELAAFRARIPEWGGAVLAELTHVDPEDTARIGALFDRHLGTCLDACHAAVEFEPPARALADAVRHGPLGKLQLSNALALARPGANAAGRELLIGLEEPRYLHQVTGVGAQTRVACNDLPELAARVAANDPEWLACDEWRCHFHVPVDLEEVGASGLGTTRAHADELLALVLDASAPVALGVAELHLEIETYTWDVLPGGARGAGDLVDGLEREYRHAFDRLERAGWARVRS